jgi:hypothetical protein
MALDFPANPANGEVFGSYVWSASKGVWQSREESATVAITSPTAPLTANNGDVWYNSSNGISYVYYDDGTSTQWVQLISTTGAPVDVSATTIDDTAPEGANDGDAWFDSSSGFLYIYYTDGTSGQWVEVKANSADTAALEARVDTLESKADFPIQLNTQTINANYTIPSGYNGMSAGPITISSGVVVTIPAGSSWSIV